MVFGYYPDDEWGNANIFYTDNTPFVGIRSYVIRFRKITVPGVDERTTFVNLPGGPGAIEGYNDIFPLPLEDLGIPTSFEYDFLIKVEARSGLNGTGAQLYNTVFIYRNHPSADLLANKLPNGPPFLPGTTTLISTDRRPTAQQSAYKYDLKHKYTGGPNFGLETVISQFTHTFPGPYTNWDEHTTSTRTLTAFVGEGPQQYWVAPKKGYNASNGMALGRWQVAHKSPNFNFLSPTVTP